MKGISLILGNDLAGDKVIVDPHVSEVPCKEAEWERGKQIDGLFPSCAVTRAMTKATLKATKEDATDNGPSSQFT